MKKYEFDASLVLRSFDCEDTKLKMRSQVFRGFFSGNFISIIQGVIQTNEVKKNLGNIHFILLRIFVLDDILQIVYSNES